MSLCNDNGKVYYNLNANGHEYVDLGLPSGTLWATMNVGAHKPSEFGLYFQWGDIQGYYEEQIKIRQKKFAKDWSDYKWANGNAITKYTTPGDTLKLEDDAANFNMGGDWHMPSPEQFDELTSNTTSAWTTSNGVSGVTFTSNIDGSKSLFIPAAGAAWDESIPGKGSDCRVWLSTLNKKDNKSGQAIMTFNSDAYIPAERYLGFSIRGVIG